MKIVGIILHIAVLQQSTSIIRRTAVVLLFKIGSTGGQWFGGVHGVSNLYFFVMCCVFGVQVAIGC